MSFGFGNRFVLAGCLSNASRSTRYVAEPNTGELEVTNLQAKWGLVTINL